MHVYMVADGQYILNDRDQLKNKNKGTASFSLVGLGFYNAFNFQACRSPLLLNFFDFFQTSKCAARSEEQTMMISLDAEGPRGSVHF